MKDWTRYTLIRVWVPNSLYTIAIIIYSNRFCWTSETILIINYLVRLTLNTFIGTNRPNLIWYLTFTIILAIIDWDGVFRAKITLWLVNKLIWLTDYAHIPIDIIFC